MNRRHLQRVLATASTAALLSVGAGTALASDGPPEKPDHQHEDARGQKTDSETGADSGGDADANAEAEADGDAGAEVDADGDAEAEADVDAGAEVDVDVDAEAEADVDAGAEVKAEVDANADATVDLNENASESSRAEVGISVAGAAVTVTSDKDLSNVRVGLADGSVEVFQGLSGTSFQYTADQEVLWVIAKSGTTMSTYGDVNASTEGTPGYYDADADADADAAADADVDADVDADADATVDLNEHANESSLADVGISVVGTTVMVTSDKDLSNVRVGLADGSVEVFEGLSGASFEYTAGQEVLWVIAKSGTTVSIHGDLSVAADADLPGYLEAGAGADTGTDTDTEGDVDDDSDVDDDTTDVNENANEASQAEMDACTIGTTAVVTSDKDISNVYAGLADGSVEVFEGLSGTSFEHDLGQEIAWVIAKSGTTVVVLGDVDAEAEGLPGYVDVEILASAGDDQVCVIDEVPDGNGDVDEGVDVDVDEGLDADVDADADADVDADAGVDVDVDTGVAGESVEADVTDAAPDAQAGVLDATVTAPSSAADVAAATAVAGAPEVTAAERLPRTGVSTVALAAMGTIAMGAGAGLRRFGR